MAARGERVLTQRHLNRALLARLAHARQSGILPEAASAEGLQHEDAAVGREFLVDGRVAGTWRYEQGRVRLERFEELDRPTRVELEEEAGRLAAFHR